MDFDFNEFLSSKIFGRILIALAILVIVFVSFEVGVYIGYRKASFSYAWSENYDRNFGGPHHGIFGIFPDKGPMMDQGLIGAHGVFGTILSIATSDLSINSPDGTERIVQLYASTTIREGPMNIKQSDLEIGEPIVVIGSPTSQGQIEARLIRVMR